MSKFQINIDSQIPPDDDAPEKDCPVCSGDGCEHCLFTGSVPMTNKEIEQAKRDAIEREL